MPITTHTVRYQKTGSEFATVEEALVDFRSGLAQEIQDALAEHETQCIANGAVTEPASYSFDAATQTLSFIKKTENVALMVTQWIHDPLRANVKGTAKQNGWVFLDENPVISTTAGKGFFDQYAENGGQILDFNNADPATVLTQIQAARTAE
jgi:hypothetical protein